MPDSTLSNAYLTPDKKVAMDVAWLSALTELPDPPEGVNPRVALRNLMQKEHRAGITIPDLMTAIRKLDSAHAERFAHLLPTAPPSGNIPDAEPDSPVYRALREFWPHRTPGLSKMEQGREVYRFLLENPTLAQEPMPGYMRLVGYIDQLERTRIAEKLHEVQGQNTDSTSATISEKLRVEPIAPSTLRLIESSYIESGSLVRPGDKRPPARAADLERAGSMQVQDDRPGMGPIARALREQIRPDGLFPLGTPLTSAAIEEFARNLDVGEPLTIGDMATNVLAYLRASGNLREQGDLVLTAQGQAPTAPRRSLQPSTSTQRRNAYAHMRKILEVLPDQDETWENATVASGVRYAIIDLLNIHGAKEPATDPGKIPPLGSMLGTYQEIARGLGVSVGSIRDAARSLEEQHAVTLGKSGRQIAVHLAHKNPGLDPAKQHEPQRPSKRGR
ncbi:MAG: hypothetical protein HOQ05_13810 [Corynebacteriales bacterium]|nr:hypothetical protein [Mycobacteriales bacterium]